MIGIIGCGFVGSSVAAGFKGVHQIDIYDKFQSEKSTVSNLSSLVEKAEILFVCLPTPMTKEGRCDISLIEDTLLAVDSSCDRLNKNIIAVIKSTIPPGTTKNLQQKLDKVSLVFNPEFLTEANHIEDFQNQKRIVLGVANNNIDAANRVKTMYLVKFPSVPYVICEAIDAEMIKYFCNCYLATKVSFANEMKQLCVTLGANYERIVEAAVYDPRISSSHLAVPGPDGKAGFGGSCFPKDINALITVMKDNNVKAQVLEAVWAKNLEVRPERDWESLKGRAIVDD